MTETTEKAAPNRTLYIVLGLVLAVAIAAGVYYWRGGFAQSGARVADKDKVDPDVALLMEPGPLPDIVIGSASAPNTIVEYASMTCPHCAQFQTEVFPQLKTKYIDTGKVRYMLREFPLDNLAAAAFMLARCAGDDRYYAMVDAMFSTQESWAMPGVDAKGKLLQIAKQAGISKEQFDQCLANKELFGKIVKTREIANDKFQVELDADLLRQWQTAEGRPPAQRFRRRTGRGSRPRPRRCRQGEDRRVNPASDRAISIQE